MITQQDLRGIDLYSSLPEAVLARIVARSADVKVGVGDWVVRSGEALYFWTILEGTAEAVQTIGGEPHQITKLSAGGYFGEIPLMLGADSSLSVRALTPVRLMRTEPAEFHLILTTSSEASAIIAKLVADRVNFRREIYVSASVMQAAIVGDRYDLACHDLRDFLSRNQISFEWLDPNDPTDAPNLPRAVLDTQRRPVVVLASGRVLEVPTLRDLADGLLLQTTPRADLYDVVIVGGGPAGLGAAVYGGSEGLRTIMIESEAPGGQAGTSSRIENYLGFPSGISGDDLANRALLQAKRFGAEILVTRTASSIESTSDEHVVVLDGGDRIRAKAVVIASGVSWRELEVDGAAELVGRGVYYGAARTEALNTREKDVFLIGGGNSAGQAAMFFSNYARSVTLLVRGASLESSMSHYLVEQLATKQNISVETHTTVVAMRGEAHLGFLTTRNDQTGKTRERCADALFVFIGADARTDWMPESLERDARGYLRTGRDIEGWKHGRPQFLLETSIPGIFAAGDVRSCSVKRVASSVGEGSMAIAFVHQYLDLVK